MARIRIVNIKNFRSIKAFLWLPSPGLNCLIGPGDSGKSSILDAIDFCLGARRNIHFSDADFHKLNVEDPITISVTIGELDDALKNIDTYGMYLRGFNWQTGAIEDEPGKGLETVLTVRLTVADDLEPSWSLVSDRAEAQGLTRNLIWADRVRLAPTRIGVLADHHLSWGRGSVLNSISEERADASAALAKAARDARAAFGEEAQEKLAETLAIVSSTAKELGVITGGEAKAMLDAYSASSTGGTISLHDEEGIPFSGLGIGSTRLLIAGLQRKAATQSKIILLDELEHGLEPHRIIRLLGSLGAKETDPPLQSFMTSHSPVALRELSGSQLFVVRSNADKHEAQIVGTSNDVQSTIRRFPEAFLAASVLICEGASEVGLVRGLDQYLIPFGCASLSACGVSLLDCGGGDTARPFARAAVFSAMGYRTAILRDDDKKPDSKTEAAYVASRGKVVAWRDGRALEDELFMSLTSNGVRRLIDYAVDLHGEQLVNDHIKSVSENRVDLNAIKGEILSGNLSQYSRQMLGRAARRRNSGWYKSVSWMEDAAREIIGPELEASEPGFKGLIAEIFRWGWDVGATC